MLAFRLVIYTSEMLDIVGRARARRIMGKKVDVQK